jgi:hypothetical protein
MRPALLAICPNRGEQKNKKNGVSMTLRRTAFAAMLFALLAGSLAAQTSVTTAHNDIARTGANTTETILTPANVKSGSFGRLYSMTVDGYVYAQPLYLPNLTMGAGTPQAGTTHNVVFIATEHDSIYAFDADNNGGANAAPLWKITLLDSAHGATAGATTVPNGDVGTSDIVPEVGITGTPVIDAATKTLYVIGKTKETISGTTTYVQRLHAIDVTTGLEKFGGPKLLNPSAQCVGGSPQAGDIWVAGNGNGSVSGVLCFDPKWENNRPALLLLNGIVYVGFAAHGDNGPWHGWLLAFNASTLATTGVWSTSPNDKGSGIWMGGAGLAADVPSGKPYGRMFTVTGNGLFNAAPTYTNAMNYGDSIVRLDLTNGVPTVVDDFTPHDQSSLNAGDVDQASGGVMLLPDSVGGGNGQHQLVQIGKSGRVYVVNRENLGGYNPNNTTDPEERGSTGGLWGAPAYWNGNVYIWGRSDVLKAFAFANGTITSTTPTSKSVESAGTYSPTPSISANGTTNGIVWSLKTDNFGSSGSATLYAHDATNVATLLYSSAQNASQDTPGASVKFVVPTIANGKVYVGTQTQLGVYGLLNGVTPASTPIINPAGQTFTGTLQVTMSDSTAGASIYYTTDGTTPTTNSTKYSSAITVSTTTTVKAIASAAGFLQSAVASQTYTLQTQTLAPTFSPVPTTYATPQTITISDATSGATIYYTLNGSTPTTSSTKYTAPITISTTTTLKAIATATGLSASPVSSGLYTITSGGSTIDFSSGFSTAQSSMTFNGSTGLDDTRLQLTSGLAFQAGSAFYNTPVNIQSFTTDFTLQLSNAGADGITFTIQGIGPTALGLPGGGLGYGPDVVGETPQIGKSVAIKFDTYDNQGEGPNSTGLYLNGVAPTIPAIDLTPSGIDLHSGTMFSAHVVYDGSNLTLTLNDPVTLSVFTHTWAVDIPTTVGASTAYVGFTGGTGGQTSSQKIGTWTFSSATGPTTATPTFSLATGTYLGTQILTISDATSGATIYYTTDGSTPTTSSTQYSGPLAITSSQTVKAIAKAGTSGVSGVGSVTLTIESQVATPSFSPVGGTYASSQTVKITSATSGATIYYTTNGTAPTKSSTQYTGPITVSSSMTLEAIASASGFFDSNVASATYTISSQVAATPTFSPAPGTYTSAQSVTLSDATSGTSIYYTTDGTTPTTSSTKYSGAIKVASNTTIKAIATGAAGFSQSAVATATYTINLPSTINYSAGFTGTGLDMNGIAKLNGTRLRLTDTTQNSAGSAWYGVPVNVQAFTSDFTFQLTTPNADGFTFVIQNAGTTALGPTGGGLGYGPDNVTNPSASANTPIAKSVAVKFDLYNNAGEGTNTTGLYTNGASPTTPATTLGGGVNLHSGDTFKVHLNYDGTTLTMTITDTVNTTQTFATSWPINIPSTVGSNTAFVGFTGGVGGSTAIQEIITWSYNSSSAAKTPVVYQTAKLAAVSSGPTFRQFTYSAFPDVTGTILDATKVGDNVTFTANVATAGTYDIKLSYKKYNTRGISQLTVNGANVSATLDQFSAVEGYATNDYGTFSFPTSGNYSFKFTVTGKNANSSSYSVSFDDLTLTPQ